MAQGNDATETTLTMVLRSKTSRTAVVIGILISVVLLSVVVPSGVLAQEYVENEPNDENPNEMPTNATVGGEVSSRDDLDRFAFHANKGENVTIVYTNLNDADPVSVTYGSQDNTSMSDYVYVESEKTKSQDSFIAPRTGMYYINISTIMPATTPKYELLVYKTKPLQLITPTATDSRPTVTPTPTQSLTSTEVTQQADTQTDENGLSALEREMSPFMMVGIGIVISGILIGLIVGAIFLIRQQ